MQECIYESPDQPPQLSLSSSFEFVHPPRNPDHQVFLHDPTRVTSSSRIGLPPVPSFPIQVPVPQLPTGQALVREPVPVHYQFVRVPLRPTLYTLPFRLADIIDPSALPISDSTTTELSMKLCVPRKPVERVSDLLPAVSLR